nr:DUF808 family protein [Algihabitans albus]
MSGSLALLDDVAAIAKLAATQLDDVAGQAAKVGSKAAEVVIDDAAVTPKYVAGLPAARELPIVWKIARASFFNKLVILLPVALLLNAFLPWLLTPLLMLGGAYLCFEGAEKIWHLVVPHEAQGAQKAETLDAAHLEQERVKGAIKTDFILSAEIMTISLAAVRPQVGVCAQQGTVVSFGVQGRQGLSPGEDGFFPFRELGDVRPDDQPVEPRIRLAILSRRLRMHLNAEGAAVDLGRARLDQVGQRGAEPVFGQQPLHTAQMGQDIRNHLLMGHRAPGIRHRSFLPSDRHRSMPL